MGAMVAHRDSQHIDRNLPSEYGNLEGTRILKHGILHCHWYHQMNEPYAARVQNLAAVVQFQWEHRQP